MNRAYLEALLEGAPLPATRKDLVRYAKRQDPGAAARLAELPDRRFSSLDEVGEALAPVQPAWAPRHTKPVVESDLPPGGPLYGRRPR